MELPASLPQGAPSAYTLGGGAWRSCGTDLHCPMWPSPAAFCCLLFLRSQLLWVRSFGPGESKARHPGALAEQDLRGGQAGVGKGCQAHIEAYFCIIPNAVYNWHWLCDLAF